MNDMADVYAHVCVTFIWSFHAISHLHQPGMMSTAAGFRNISVECVGKGTSTERLLLRAEAPDSWHRVQNEGTRARHLSKLGWNVLKQIPKNQIDASSFTDYVLCVSILDLNYIYCIIYYFIRYHTNTHVMFYYITCYDILLIPWGSVASYK